jgi:hypothetical protein
MTRRKSNENRKMWVTPMFRKSLYEQKAESPDKTLFDIQDDIAKALREQSLKLKGGKDNAPFFGRL